MGKVFDMNPVTPPDTSNTLDAPVAKTIPASDTRHGETRTDNYRWLREKNTPEVTAYLESENAYTDAFMQPTQTLQTRLYDEMLARIQETDLSVPYKQNGYLYYSRTEEGKQYPLHCRTKDVLDADEEVILDVNALAEGQDFMAIGVFAVSDDNNLLAYSTDNTGFREYTLHIKDLRTGDLLPETIEHVGSMAWAQGSQTFWYGVEDAMKRDYRIFRHTLGESDPAGANDFLVYEEADALFNVGVHRSRDNQIVFLHSEAHTATEIRFLPADLSSDTPQLIAPRKENHEYYAEHRNGTFFIRTNDNAVNFRLVSAPASDPAPPNWTEIVPHEEAVMLADHDVFARHLVLTRRVEGLPMLQIRTLDAGGAPGDTHDITFPEPAYNVSGDTNREFDTDLFRFRYTSLVTPLSVFDYDMQTRERVLLKETPVLGPYDKTDYVSERLFATASDGTRIPLSVVYKKGLEKNGTNPTFLYGYGSYGISMPAGFSSGRLSLLDRGVVFVIAHIRGGGELGKPWHDMGKMAHKMNTFTDFIAAAEYLIKEKFTSPEKLIIGGGSAGGLLMGATVNLRPDLFHAVLSHVPFVDVLNTMLDDTLPLTVGEYVEWGNPNVAEEYAVMRTYCPYTNLEEKDYPAMLLKTSLNDSQVMYWEPAKYVAKLRTLKTDTQPLLLHTNMAAGHGGASGRYDALKETAFDYAFLLKMWGLG